MSGCSCRLWPLCLLIAVIAASCARGAEVAWTGGGGDLRWSNPLNWAGGRVPGVGDDVVVPELPGEVMIEVTSSVHVRSIVCEEGIAYPSHILTVDAASRIAVLGDGYSLTLGATELTVTEGGVLPEIIHSTAPGTTVGVLVIAAGADVEMRWTRGVYAKIRNEGVLRWTGTTVMDSATSSIDNRGVWELSGEGVRWVGTGRIRNYGTIRRSGTGVVRIYNRSIAFELESSGHIEVESGTLALESVGVISGSCEIAADATLRAVPFYSTVDRRLRFAEDMTITGGGQLEVGWAVFEGGLASGGAVRIVGPTTVSGRAILSDVELVSGTLNFEGECDLASLAVIGPAPSTVTFDGESRLGAFTGRNAPIYGDGTLTVTGQFALEGTINGIGLTGGLVIAEGGSCSSHNVFRPCDIANHGEFSFTRTSSACRSFRQSGSGVLRMSVKSVGLYSYTAPAQLGGTLLVTVPEGFDPLSSCFVELRAIVAPSIIGRFDTVILPPPPVVGAYELKESDNSILVVHDVFDYNGDGDVDLVDLGAFFARWDTGDRYADVNADGATDSDDVAFFLAGWEAGGR